MSILRHNKSGSTGDADGSAAGTVAAGNTIFMGSSFQKVQHLAALLDVTADTASFTWTAKWQGSNDETTWVDLANGSQNAAGVALATGGAVTNKNTVLEAPQSVYSYRFARCSLVTGGDTGAAADVYSIAYNYRQLP